MTTNGVAPMPLPNELELNRWRELVERRSGLDCDGPRARILQKTALERAVSGGYATVAEYFRRMESRPSRDPEWADLIDRLRNGDTRFFRDAPAFAALESHALPGIVRRRRFDCPLRIDAWSAGCSTGQEAYSLAAACLSSSVCAGWKIGVEATDTNRAAIRRAQTGIYRPFETTTLPPELEKRFFHRENGEVRVGDELRAAVRFRRSDLLDLPPNAPRRDLIFCQNVLVYYGRAARAELLRRLTAALAPGGFLFLGAAEVVGVPMPGLQPIRLPDTRIYRRAD